MRGPGRRRRAVPRLPRGGRRHSGRDVPGAPHQRQGLTECDMPAATPRIVPHPATDCASPRHLAFSIFQMLGWGGERLRAFGSPKVATSASTLHHRVIINLSTT